MTGRTKSIARTMSILCAELLLVGASISAIYAARPVDDICAQYLTGIEHRLSDSRIPEEYRTSIYGRRLDFIVTPGVYVSKNETVAYTYHLLEVAHSKIKPNARILILGVGVGYEMVAIGKKFFDRIGQLDGSDISPLALKVTAANMEYHGVSENKTKLVLSDGFKSISGRYDLIVFASPRAVSTENALRILRTSGYSSEAIEKRMATIAEARDLFDLDGKLRRRILYNLDQHLTQRGSLLILSNAGEGIPKDIHGFQSTEHGHWPWTAAKTDGDYTILEVMRKKR